MKNLLILSLILISANLIFSQNKSFSLEVNNDTILLGNYIIAKFSVSNIDGNFEAPNLQDFQIVSGPNTSSMFSMVNGETTRESSYTYYLKPLKEGDNFIDPAYIFGKSDTLETNPYNIFVLPNPEGKIIEPKQPKSRMFNFSLPEDKIDLYPNDKQPSLIKKKKKNKLKTRKL